MRHTNASTVHAMRPDPGRTRHDGSAWERSQRSFYWPLWAFMLALTAYVGAVGMGWAGVPDVVAQILGG